ncbi:hypothetical protein FRC02_000507 [Tulasnella sp. 418]|nr:hypothetical protein FRC02_000507 [Tulasnella sp. 418]
MVPRLDFNPALASTTIVPLTHSVSKHVGINFYVTMSRFWFDKFKQEGRRVEVWSNIPIEGVPYHAWSEKAFVERDVVKNEIVDLEESEAVAAISLIDADYEAAVAQARLSTEASDSGDRVTLVAHYAIPQIEGTYYSFTFRITGPGGHVDWLGNMGTNGTIILDGQPIKHVGLSEKEPKTWKAEEDGKTWEKPTTTEASEVEVAHFKELGMSGWAFSQDGPKQISTTSSTPASSFILLHPDPVEQGEYPLVDAPSSLLLISDTPSSISIKDDSILSTSGSALSVKELNASSLDAVNSLIAGATFGTYEVIHVTDDNNFIFVSSAPSASFIPSSNPQKISIIPVTPQKSEISVVSIPTELLHALQPATPALTLYSEASDAVVSINGDYQHDIVKVTVGRNGGDLTVVPSYTLKGEKQEDHEDVLWKISIIHPAVSPINVVDVLPPPPKVPEPVVEPEVPAEIPQPAVEPEKVEPVAEATPVPEPAVSEEIQPAPTDEVAEGEKKPDEVVVAPEPAPVVVSSKPSKSPKRLGFFRLCFAKVMFWIRVFLQFWAAGWLFRTKPPRKGGIAKTEEAKIEAVPEMEKKKESSDPVEAESKPVVEESAQSAVPAELKGKANELKTTMITPPITPPQSPLTIITSDPFNVPISSVVPPPPVAPTKQRLEFTLPPNANKLAYVIQGIIAKDAAVTVDGKDVTNLLSLKNGKHQGSFIVTVDIPADIKTEGKVEITC